MSAAFDKLRDTVARLRAPDGCPWDREQTNETLIPKLLEEAYEVGDAVRSGDDDNLREELGDVMLLVIMHAQIASERGKWRIEQVVEEITAKLIRRHPHVFGDREANDADAVVKLWDSVKREEQQHKKEHYLAGVAAALPALMRAQKIQKKAAHVHFDWAELSDVVAKVDEELAETKEALSTGNSCEIAEEIGDLLFALVNLARKTDHDAETLLQSATDKFARRFSCVEDELHKQGRKLGEVGLAELDEIWNAHKAARASL